MITQDPQMRCVLNLETTKAGKRRWAWGCWYCRVLSLIRDENPWLVLPSLLDSCLCPLSGMQLGTTVVRLGDELEK